MLNKSLKAVISNIDKTTSTLITDNSLVTSSYGGATTVSILHDNKSAVELEVGSKAGIEAKKIDWIVDLSTLKHIKTQTLTMLELEHLMTAMAVKDIRYYLNGLALFDQNCSIATDGHRMHTVNYNVGVATNVPCAIVPGESIKLIHKLMKANKANRVDFEVYTDSRIVEGFYCQVAIGDASIIIKCVDGRYPDCARVYPSFGSRVQPEMGRQDGILNPLTAKQITAYKQVIKFTKSPFIGARTVDNETTIYNPIKSEKHKIAEDKLESLNAMLKGSPLLKIEGVNKEHTPVFNMSYLLAANACAGGLAYVKDENSSILIEKGNLAAVIMPMRA